MTTGPAPETYRELLLFLATAGVIVPLFGRLKVSPVLGFLAAGVALGPFGLGALAREVPLVSAVAITNVGQIAHLAEFGVAFLLFMIALELSWERLMRLRKLVFGMGSLQLVVSSLVLGLAAFALGQAPASATVLGSALAMSSTALVLPSLAERKRLSSTAGRASFAVLLFQDLAVAPLLFLVTILGSREGLSLGSGLLYALAPAVVALVGIVLVGRLILKPLLRLVAATQSNELFVAACLLVVIGTGLITAASGQSMAIGAFVAGLLLAETEYRREIEVTIQPFQGLLLGVFFVSVGVSLDLSHVFADPALTIGIAVALVVTKFLIVWPIAEGFGLPRRSAREAALLLSPGGEFALVVIGTAIMGGVVPASVGASAMVAATLSMFAIPFLVRLSEHSRARPPEAAPATGLTPDVAQGPARVIIVGYGRVGELIGQMLARHDVPFLSVDSDPGLVGRQRRDGREIFYGDASRIEFLRRCGIATAPALVVTMDSPKAVEMVVAAARAERPDLTIVARARDASHAKKLYGLKVTDAVPETIEASLQLSEALLIDIGIPMGLVIASIHEKRDEFRRALQGPKDEERERRAIRSSTRR